jgi:hypothetical protein
VNSLFQQHPKRSCRRALDTLLLALPLSGIALQLPQAQAQPATPLPAKKSPLSPEQKATVEKLLALSVQEHLCKSRIALKVDGASLEGVIARIKEVLPNEPVAIEVRGASPVRVGFDLKDASVSDVLQPIAALSGCKLWVLSRGLLIAPPSQLTKAEWADVNQSRGGEWAKNATVGTGGRSSQDVKSELFTQAIAQEATGSQAKPLPPQVMKTTFGSFSPQSQAMMQEIVGWMNEGEHNSNPNAVPLHLNAGSSVTVDTTSPYGVTIYFGGGTSDAATPNYGYQRHTIDVGRHQ